MPLIRLLQKLNYTPTLNLLSCRTFLMATISCVSMRRAWYTTPNDPLPMTCKVLTEQGSQTEGNMTAHQVINYKCLFNFLKAAAAGVSILLTVINWLCPSLTDSLIFSESVFQAYSAYDDSSSRSVTLTTTKFQL